MNEISDEGPILPLWLPLAASVVLLVGLFLGYKVTKDDPRIGVGIMAGSVIPAAITALQFIRLRRALGTATLQMRDELVPLGWSGTVTYVRPLNGATVQSIEARLQCEEHVEKGRGRGRRVWRRVVVDEPLSPQTAPYATQLQVQIPIKIPAAGPPTFHYTDNEINWWVRLHLKMEGCPNTRSSFKLSVMPAVVGQ
jgi:hypothetical protein